MSENKRPNESTKQSRTGIAGPMIILKGQKDHKQLFFFFTKVFECNEDFFYATNKSSVSIFIFLHPGIRTKFSDLMAKLKY